MSYVYFFVTQGPHGVDMCKIGFTRSHPERRRQEVQGMCPVELDLFAFVEGDLQLEKKLHRTFTALNYHGEWFELRLKLRDFVWTLLPDGPSGTLTSIEQFRVAVYDCILSDYPPGPDIDLDEWLDSADQSEWLHIERLYFSEGATVQ